MKNNNFLDYKNHFNKTELTGKKLFFTNLLEFLTNPTSGRVMIIFGTSLIALEIPGFIPKLVVGITIGIILLSVFINFCNIQKVKHLLYQVEVIKKYLDLKNSILKCSLKNPNLKHLIKKELLEIENFHHKQKLVELSFYKKLKIKLFKIKESLENTYLEYFIPIIINFFTPFDLLSTGAIIAGTIIVFANDVTERELLKKKYNDLSKTIAITQNGNLIHKYKSITEIEEKNELLTSLLHIIEQKANSKEVVLAKISLFHDVLAKSIEEKYRYKNQYFTSHSIKILTQDLIVLINPFRTRFIFETRNLIKKLIIATSISAIVTLIGVLYDYIKFYKIKINNIDMLLSINFWHNIFSEVNFLTHFSYILFIIFLAASSASIATLTSNSMNRKKLAPIYPTNTISTAAEDYPEDGDIFKGDENYSKAKINKYKLKEMEEQKLQHKITEAEKIKRAHEEFLKSQNKNKVKQAKNNRSLNHVGENQKRVLGEMIEDYFDVLEEEIRTKNIVVNKPKKSKDITI